MNEFQQFELGLPFVRINFSFFVEAVKSAAINAKEQGIGDGTTLTIEALSEKLTTPAWEGLKDPESKIYKVISSSVFH